MERRLFLSVFALAFVVGAWFRLHGVTQQLIVSDEWHGLHAAAWVGYGELFSLMTPGATSIPLNLYYKMLLDTVGWSEFWLRLPSLLAGVASLIVLPIISRRWLGLRAQATFCALLAISPMLIFFSRYSRPYALVVLLTFAGLVACHTWWRTGRTRYALGFSVAGVLATWLHVVEIRMLALPLAYYAAVWLVSRPGGASPESTASSGSTDGPGLRGLIVVGVATSAALGLLLLPAVLSGGDGFANILGKGWVETSTIMGAVELLLGTWHPAFAVLFLALAARGGAALLRRDPVFAGLLFTIIVGTLATVVATRPHHSQLPVVFARYMIPAQAPILLFAALGLHRVLASIEARSAASGGFVGRYVPYATVTAAIALPVSLFFHGPLPVRASTTNNFSNNKCFQVSYAPLETGDTYFFRLSRALKENLDFRPAMSPFYESLAADYKTRTVVEYPVPIGDKYSALPDYQQKHGKRVIGGFRPMDPPKRVRVQPGLAPASWLAGIVLGAVEDPGALRFTSYVNIEDVAAVQATGARYLIVHRNPSREVRGQPPKKRSRVPPHFAKAYGGVVYQDDWLFVFDLQPGQSPSGR